MGKVRQIIEFVQYKNVCFDLLAMKYCNILSKN